MFGGMEMKQKFQATFQLSENSPAVYRDELLSKLHEEFIFEQLKKYPKEQKTILLEKIIKMK